MSMWLAFAPLGILLVGGLLIMLVDAFTEENSELALVTASTLFISSAIAFAALMNGGEVAELPEFVSAYITADPMALFFDGAIGLGGGLCALLAGGYLNEHGLERGEFYVLMIFSALGAMVLAHAVDMLSLFVGLETMSLGVYAMVAFRRTSARAIEGSVKYFLLGSFAAALLLMGAAFIYAGTGQTSFAGIHEAIVGTEAHVGLVIMGMMLVIVGLAFKVSAVPFHMWTPDAYEGAVTPATTFMSVAVKSAAFAVFVRVCMVAFGDELSASGAAGWPPVLAGLAIVSMLYGNIAAISQENVKRMLAYSSIAHAGYLLVGLSAAFRVREEGISAVLFYLLAYTVSNVLAFGSLIYLGSRARETTTFADLRGVGRRHPLAAAPFVLGVLSLMGFPPTAGFFGKYYVFRAAVQAGDGYVWLAVFGVLTSAIGAYYYLRVIVAMFMREAVPGQKLAVPMRSGYVVAALSIAGLLVLELGLMPGDMLELAIHAAQQLLA